MGYRFLEYNSLTSSAAASSGSEDSESDTDLTKFGMVKDDFVVKVPQSNESSCSPRDGDTVLDKATGRECRLHQVTKLDTIAGLAIKYGVEVAEIKRINRISTDLQLFALKFVRVPLPLTQHFQGESQSVSRTPSKPSNQRHPTSSSSGVHPSSFSSLPQAVDPVKEIASSIQDESLPGSSLAAMAAGRRNTFFFTQMREAAQYLASGADEGSPHSAAARHSDAGASSSDVSPAAAFSGGFRGSAAGGSAFAGGSRAAAAGGLWGERGAQDRGGYGGAGGGAVAGRAGGGHSSRGGDQGTRRRSRQQQGQLGHSSDVDEESGWDSAGRYSDDVGLLFTRHSQQRGTNPRSSNSNASGGASLGQFTMWGSRLMEDLVTRLQKTAALSGFEAQSSALLPTRRPGRGGSSGLDAGSIDLPVLGTGRTNLMGDESADAVMVTPTKPAAGRAGMGGAAEGVLSGGRGAGSVSEGEESGGEAVALGGSASKGMSAGQLSRRSAGSRRSTGPTNRD